LKIKLNKLFIIIFIPQLILSKFHLRRERIFTNIRNYYTLANYPLRIRKTIFIVHAGFSILVFNINSLLCLACYLVHPYTNWHKKIVFSCSCVYFFHQSLNSCIVCWDHSGCNSFSSLNNLTRVLKSYSEVILKEIRKKNYNVLPKFQ